MEKTKENFKVGDNIYFEYNYRVYYGCIIAIVEKAYTPYVIKEGDNKIYLAREESIYRTKESAIFDTYKYYLRYHLRFLLEAKDSIDKINTFYDKVITEDSLCENIPLSPKIIEELKSLNSKIITTLKPLLNQMQITEEKIWKISDKVRKNESTKEAK